MNYKFVDIGTCYYATSVDDFGLDVNGLLVDPIQKFIDVLPSSNTVKKECCAITEVDGEVEFNTYFDKNFDSFELKYFTSADRERWRKEKTFIDGKTKPLHSAKSSLIDHPWDHVLKHQKKIKVNGMRLETLFKKYNVLEIDHLRIDTEGFDHKILEQVIELLSENKIKINNEISFEYIKDFRNTDQLDLLEKEICNKFNFIRTVSKKDGDHSLIRSNNGS